MTTLLLRNSISRSPLGRGFLLIALALCCFALAPAPNAFGVSPAPDGGYPGANTAEGQNALQSLSSGFHNTALGFETLFSDTTGNFNTATGSLALFHNTTGSNNTANGRQALFHNTTGSQNTANGSGALFSNTTGIDNTANGDSALYNNTTGSQNTANGYQALTSNTADANTATGFAALYSNTTGTQNTANGNRALYSNTTGNYNTAVGQQALQANTGGYFNIALGIGAGGNLTEGGGNIYIGHGGAAVESNTIRIGVLQSKTFIAGIRGVTTGNADAVAVVVDSVGQLGTMSSSRRFKKEIKPMDQTSQAILGLQPVTFQYKSDSTGTAQFGLIAEEVAQVDPDLVVRDAEGEIYSVRYEAVNAMLLNEFLKEHRTVQELKSTGAKQEATIAQQQKDFESKLAKQQKEIQALIASLKKQASQIQKVSAQLEVSSPRRAPQVVVNDQ